MKTQKCREGGSIWNFLSSSSNKQKTQKRKTEKNNKTVSLAKLRELTKKYQVTSSGSKEEVALRLWKIGGVTLSNDDLLLICDLLPPQEQRKVKLLVNKRNHRTTTNYKGMWEPLPKPLSKMDRDELIKNLQKFRDAWEKETGRNQDLSDERLNKETVNGLRRLLKFYYSTDAKRLAEEWLSK